MRKAASILAIILLAGSGAFLAMGYMSDDRGAGRRRQHLSFIREQLASIGDLVRQYKATHGRYPTNDEGLSVLDLGGERIDLNVYVKQWDDEEVVWYPEGRGTHWLKQFPGWLKWYRREYRRTPRAIDESIETSIWFGRIPEEKGECMVVPMTVALTSKGDPLLVWPAGILTPWLVPYVYENRQGLEAKSFPDSPADSDPRRRFSVCVDEGVCVYSVGGQVLAHEADRMWWEYNLPRFLGCALLLAALALTIVMVRTSVVYMLSGLLLFGVSAVLGGSAGSVRATCYVSMSLFSFRDAKMVAQQRALLDRYHQAGVLGDEAYRKAVWALELHPTTQPASAPAKAD